MRHGIEDIDTMFGVGYAKAHPELLAAYMRTAAVDLMTATLAEQIGGAVERIASAIEEAKP